MLVDINLMLYFLIKPSCWAFDLAALVPSTKVIASPPAELLSCHYKSEHEGNTRPTQIGLPISHNAVIQEDILVCQISLSSQYN